MKNFLALLTAHLNLVPMIASAAQTFQSIGHSKESTLQKVLDIVKASLTVGEAVPIPIVQAISTTAEGIVNGVFGTPGGAAPGPVAVPPVAPIAAAPMQPMISGTPAPGPLPVPPGFTIPTK